MQHLKDAMTALATESLQAIYGAEDIIGDFDGQTAKVARRVGRFSHGRIISVPRSTHEPIGRRRSPMQCQEHKATFGTPEDFWGTGKAGRISIWGGGVWPFAGCGLGLTPPGWTPSSGRYAKRRSRWGPSLSMWREQEPISEKRKPSRYLAAGNLTRNSAEKWRSVYCSCRPLM